jgi:ATP-binding cassette subfamily F protein 3
LLIVSHDRYLINKIADRIYAFDPVGVREYRGNYDNYLEQSRSASQTAEKKDEPEKPNEYRLQKERGAALRRDKAALKRAENKIEQDEQEIQQLEEKLCEPETASDYEAAMELTAKIEALKQEVETLMEEWAALSEKIGDT